MKLYCGTYAKYNNGSLYGKWMDLDKYANADEFEQACRRLHHDEREPEFMFQDVETDPGEDWQEGLYSECSIPREYWKLKAEAEAAKASQTAPKGAKAKERAEQEALCREYVETREGITQESAPKKWERWWKYYRKGFYYYRLADGTIASVSIPSIETRFCCGEDDRGQGGEGPGTMAYALKTNAEKHTERGFTFANLHRFDNENGLERVEEATLEYATASEERRRQMRDWKEANVLAVVRKQWGEVEWTSVGSAYWDSNVIRIFTADDFARMRKAIAHVRAEFVKRLAAWWKRFGSDHIHTWTYWTEA